MNNDDLQKLKAAAEASIAYSPCDWYSEEEKGGIFPHDCDLTLISLSTPQAILALIAEVEQAQAVKQEPKYGCHIDLPSPEYDACVLDGGNPADCMYAERYGEEGRKKCGEWKPVVFVAPQ